MRVQADLKSGLTPDYSSSVVNQHKLQHFTPLAAQALQQQPSTCKHAQTEEDVILKGFQVFS